MSRIEGVCFICALDVYEDDSLCSPIYNHTVTCTCWKNIDLESKMSFGPSLTGRYTADVLTDSVIYVLLLEVWT